MLTITIERELTNEEKEAIIDLIEKTDFTDDDDNMKIGFF